VPREYFQFTKTARNRINYVCHSFLTQQKSESPGDWLKLGLTMDWIYSCTGGFWGKWGLSATSTFQTTKYSILVVNRCFKKQNTGSL